MSGVVQTIQIEPAPGPDRFWQAVRDVADASGVFEVKDVSDTLNGSRSTFADYFRRLVLAGYVKSAGMSASRAVQYQVVRPERFAPRLDKNGKPARAALVQDHMWRAMKMVKRWSARDLCRHASRDEVVIAYHSAQTYVKLLRDAGYLHVWREAAPSIEAIYSLKPDMETGPRAPTVLSGRMVFDLNRGCIMTKTVVAREVRS